MSTEQAPLGSPDVGGLFDYRGPTPEELNPPREPLPEPELQTVEEIVEAFGQEGYEDLAVVSMLDKLGIGIYRVDGTPIRVGAETSDSDFYLFEDEVYGLSDRLRAQYDGEEWINFRDFHEALVGFGLESSPEELAQAYNDAYAESFDEPIVQFVQAQAFIDVEAQIAPLGVWLMFLDGMVLPNGSNEPVAMVGSSDAPPAAAPARPRWAAARRNVQALNWSRNPDQAAMAAHLMLILPSATIKLEPQPATVHKLAGHGGPTSMTIIASVQPYGATSPFGGLLPSLPTGSGSPAGINVTWNYADPLTSHGSSSVGPGGTSATDARGDARLIFTPGSDPTNEEEYLMHETGSVTASVPVDQVVRTMFPGFRGSLGRLVGNANRVLTASTDVTVEWHEPAVLQITLEYEYDILLKNNVAGDVKSKGTDTLTGHLQETAIGYEGQFLAISKGSGGGFFGGRFTQGCATTWYVAQHLHGLAVRQPGIVPGADPLQPPTGDFTIVFIPKTGPQGSLGQRRCRPTLRPDGRGKRYAPYSDARITDREIGLSFELPVDPGGTKTYCTLQPPLTNVVINKACWTVTVTYLAP